MFTIKKPKVDTNWALGQVYDLVVSGEDYGAAKVPKNAETDEVGIEFELEGENLKDVVPALKSKGCDFWSVHLDGSLRNGGLEFTFTKALNREHAKKAMTDFWSAANEKAKVKNSDRCSTHMHLNFQHMTIMQVYSFLTLFYMLELPFFKVFAPERVGNGYCMPMFECPTIGQNFGRNLREGVMKYGMNGSERYCALNVASLRKHGSIECRMLGASESAEKPTQWMEILLELYDYVKANPRVTPEELLNNFRASDDAYTSFTQATFPKVWAAIEHLKDVSSLIKFGVFAVQDFVYAVDWTPTKTATPPKKARAVNPDKMPVSTPLFDSEFDDFVDFDDYD